MTAASGRLSNRSVSTWFWEAKGGRGGKGAARRVGEARAGNAPAGATRKGSSREFQLRSCRPRCTHGPSCHRRHRARCVVSTAPRCHTTGCILRACPPARCARCRISAGTPHRSRTPGARGTTRRRRGSLHGRLRKSGALGTSQKWWPGVPAGMVCLQLSWTWHPLPHTHPARTCVICRLSWLPRMMTTRCGHRTCSNHGMWEGGRPPQLPEAMCTQPWPGARRHMQCTSRWAVKSRPLLSP